MPPKYVLDTSAFRVLGEYYPETFPSFWERLNEMAGQGRLLSVREAKAELDAFNRFPHITDWCNNNSVIFLSPTEEEMFFVRRIFEVPHFRALIGIKEQARPVPVADPWLIALAARIGAYVVTQEASMPNAAKIPNVCDRFGVLHTNVQGMLTLEGWRF